MFCVKCGTENSDDNKYCYNCGASFNKIRTPPPAYKINTGDIPTFISEEDKASLFDEGTLIRDRYVIKTPLRKTRMSIVYQVYDKILNELAALKMMHPRLILNEKERERFINEAKISIYLSHDNIVDVRDIEEFKNILYISMEYLGGRTLREHLVERKKSGAVFSLLEVLKIILQISDGLAYAHRYTVHCDIKPENIMILPDGKVKIMDFGIAMAIGVEQFARTNKAMGTAYYIAPELLSPSQSPSKFYPRIDIYSVGVIFFEMLTGELPIGIYDLPHEKNPDLPEDIDEIIKIALKNNPEERYQDIEEFKNALHDVINLIPALRKELFEKPKAITKEIRRRPTKAPDLKSENITCPFCYTINSRDKHFCVNCGENLKVKCPQCKMDIDVDLNYCGKCGVNIAEYRENLISGYIKSAKEYIAKKDFDLSKREIKKIEEVDRKHPAIGELHSLIIKEKERLSEIKKIVSSAADLLRQKNYNRASEEVDKVLKLDENHPEALHIAEKIESMQNEIKNLKAAIKKCLNNLQLNEAQSLFEKLVEIEHLDSQWKAKRSELQRMLKHVKELKGAVKRFIQDKEFDKALKQIAHLSEIIRNDKEIAILEKDVTKTLQHIKNIEEKAEHNLNSHKFDKALKYLEQLKQLNPNDETIVNRINYIKLKIEEKQAKAKRRLFITALVALVVVAGVIVVSLLIQAHKRYLQKIDNDYNMAVSLQQDGMYIQAKKKFEQFIAQYPDSDYIPDVNQRLENIEDKVTAQKVKEMEIAYNIAVKLQEDKKYLQAVEEFEQFIAQYPDSRYIPDVNQKIAKIKAEENGLLQMADTLFEQGLYLSSDDNNAVNKYKQLLEFFNPENKHAKDRLELISNFYLEKAKEAYNNKRYLSPPDDNVLKYINNILSFDSNNKLALNMKKKIGAHYQKQADNSRNAKDFKAAKRYYQSLQVIYPDVELIQRRINQCDAEIEQQRLAALNAQKVADLLKEADNLFSRNAYLSPENNNAVQKYHQVLKIDPENKLAKKRLQEISNFYLQNGDSALAANDIAKAKSYFEKAVQAGASSDLIKERMDAVNAKEMEEAAFNAAKAKGDVDSWIDFIEQFPDSMHIEYAKEMKRSIMMTGWPMFRFDSKHSGCSPYEGPWQPHLKWTFSCGAAIVSSPAIGSDGTIYVGSSDGKLYAINSDGSRKWEFNTRKQVVSSPAIGADGTIYVGSKDNKLYAIRSNGNIKWTYATGGWIESSPAIGADGTIYVGSHDRNLHAINPNGSRKWVFSTGGVVYSSPAIGADGTIYVGSKDNKLYAIRPNGSMKWTYATGGWIESSPAIGADGTVYIGSSDCKLYAINIDGYKKWDFTTSGWVESSPAIGADGTIYVGSHDYRLYAIYPNGRKKWEFLTGEWVLSSPAIGADGIIYVGSSDGKLYSIYPDGNKNWEFFIGKWILSSPAIGADGTIYVGSNDGKFYAIGKKR